MQARGVAVTGDTDFVDPQWGYPEYPPGSVVELRVHGVGGEGPEGMTRDPHPVAIGGDELVGFWRSRNPVVTRLGERALHAREVVSWGGSTSGASGAAWWVVLLPFGLFNVAGRMHRSDARSRRAAAHRSICRLLALTMTLSFVGMAAGVAFDLLAVQCASQVTCVEAELTGRWLLGPLRTFDGDVGALLGMLAVLVALVVVGLRRAGRRNSGDLEGSTPSVEVDRNPVRLDDVGFWNNLWPAWRLRSVHTTAGYAWVAVVLALALRSIGADAGLVRTLVVVEVVVLIACGLLTLLPAIVQPSRDGRIEPATLVLRVVALGILGLLVGVGLSHQARVDRAWWTGSLVALLIVGGLVSSLRTAWLQAGGDRASSGTSRDLGLAIGATSIGLLPVVRDAFDLTRQVPASVLQSRAAGDSAGMVGTIVDGLPEFVYDPVWLLVGVQVLLLLALGVVAFEKRRDRVVRDDVGALDDAAVPGNLGAPIVALISLLLVTAVGAGLHALVLDWLGTRAPTTGAVETTSEVARDGVGLMMPWWYVLTALVVVVLALLLALAVGVLLRRASESVWPLPQSWALRPDADTVRAGMQRGYAAPEPDVDIDAVVDDVAAQATNAAVIRLGGIALLTVVGVVTAGVFLLTPLVLQPWDKPLPFTTQALLVVVAIPPAFVAQIRSGRKDRAARKRFGNLWDILTFWPRVTHPFAPPCYGERLVPAVAARVGHLHRGGCRVVLAGHSQGSVVVLAAAVHPDAAACAPDLVTYGSPLGILYERFYPGVFAGPDGAIAAGVAAARTWHNVMGLTEPLGSPLFAGSLADPVTDRRAFRRGWPVIDLLNDATRPCPVCGWRIHGAPGGADLAGRVAAGGPTTVDVLVTDPDRVTSPLGLVEGRALGHSTYHRHRELDEHVAHLAR